MKAASFAIGLFALLAGATELSRAFAADAVNGKPVAASQADAGNSPPNANDAKGGTGAPAGTAAPQRPPQTDAERRLCQVRIGDACYQTERGKPDGSRNGVSAMDLCVQKAVAACAVR